MNPILRYSMTPLLQLCLAAVGMTGASAEELSIEAGQFRLVAEATEATASSALEPSESGGTAVAVEVTKPCRELWSVELQASGVVFEAGKKYVLTFRAKAEPAKYVYFVPEKEHEDQASIAEGTTLKIPEEWTACTVVFQVTADANPGRLTITNLGANPGQFWISDVRIVW
jgi:Carbohydrate binding domain